MGLEIKDFPPSLHIPPEDQDYIESFFKKLPFLPRNRSLPSIPGPVRRQLIRDGWPEQYSQLADCLIRELGASVIFTWGPAELKWVEGIRNGMKELSILAPRTETLTQLGEILRRCDLYIGGDTGPMHIASFVGTPAVVIYGPTDPVVNEPLGRHVKIQKGCGM